MSIEYLEELAGRVCLGAEVYACSLPTAGEWVLSLDKDALREEATRYAEARPGPATVYRLLPPDALVPTDGYLVALKLHAGREVSGRIDQRTIDWGIVDTREAAELLRDVSCGPTPYFGVVVEEVVTLP